MEHVIDFIKLTKKLADFLETNLPNEGREEYIQSIHDLLDEREILLKKLPDLSNVIDENVKGELIQLENKLKGLMIKHKSTIKKDLQVLQLKKKKTNNYSNPYGVSADGMFLDKRK